MKKISIFIVALFIGIMLLNGCRFSDDSGETIVLENTTDEVHKEILAILNSGIWVDDVCQCISDFTFEIQGNKIKYSSECGTFNDTTNRKNMNLTKQEKLKVNQLLGVESALPTPTKCPDSVLPTSVFDTKNIKRITFYIDYGLGKGNDVSADDMEEIIKWLETFTIDKKVDGTSPPGTNTIYVEIEYLDGTIVKNGIDKIEVDGASYYIKRAIQPDCLHKILTK